MSISSENVTLLYGATLQLECASPAMEVPLEWKWLANGTEINNIDDVQSQYYIC